MTLNFAARATASGFRCNYRFNCQTAATLWSLHRLCERQRNNPCRHKEGSMDCFVAPRLAMTWRRTSAHSAARIAPGLCFKTSAPKN